MARSAAYAFIGLAILALAAGYRLREAIRRRTQQRGLIRRQVP